MNGNEYDCHDMDIADAGKMIAELETENKKLRIACKLIAKKEVHG